MKAVLITIVVAAVLFFLVKLLIELVGMTDALIIVGCCIVGYYLAKDV